MKLITYKVIPPGIKGLQNRIISWRLNSSYTHSELAFEPKDNVDAYMPDKTTEPIDGAYWCISSAGSDILPPWSPKRAGERGGVRIKRINIYNGKWIVNDSKRDPIKAIETFKKLEGNRYDWQLIMKYALFLMQERESRRVCSEFVAEALGYQEPWRFDPPTIYFTELNNN